VDTATELAGPDDAAVRDLLARALLAAIENNLGLVRWMDEHATRSVFHLTPLGRRPCPLARP